MQKSWAVLEQYVAFLQTRSRALGQGSRAKDMKRLANDKWTEAARSSIRMIGRRDLLKGADASEWVTRCLLTTQERMHGLLRTKDLVLEEKDKASETSGEAPAEEKLAAKELEALDRENGQEDLRTDMFEAVHGQYD